MCIRKTFIPDCSNCDASKKILDAGRFEKSLLLNLNECMHVVNHTQTECVHNNSTLFSCVYKSQAKCQPTPFVKKRTFRI